MAREEIKLVGSFKDDITPQLKKLNKEIANIGRSFKRFNKSIAPVTKSFAKMAMSAREFANAMQMQRRGIDNSARAMREYSRQAGKMSAAMRKVSAQREKDRRAQGMSRAEARRQGGAMPGAGPSRGGKSGANAGAQMARGFNGGIKSTAIGVAIGNMASQALMKGMQALKTLALAPFKKFGSMFAERIKDEMDDIKSAGGLFALDMSLTEESGNERFFKNYNEALRFQEKLNISMAESAASLPGVTSQYVDTSRQLTDTIQMVMEKDREGFNKMAEAFGADTSMGGVDASKNAMQRVLQKQTEQVMLQSQGQTGGLPMHIMIQQLMGKEAKGGKLGIMAMTNKFRAAFQKNPLLKNFLLRAEDELAKTEAGSADRLRILMETFDAAMPKEVINKMRGSISGMQEALRSGLLDPQAGLFGMSRANFGKDGQKIMKKNVDDFGNVLFKLTEDVFPKTPEIQKMLESKGIEKGLEESLKGLEFTAEEFRKMGFTVDELTGVVSKNGREFGKFSKSSTYVFEQIREIMAGYGPVLLEFVGFLPMIFDPFGQMTESLLSYRETAQKFISGFNKKLDVLEADALKYSQSESSEKKGIGALLKSQSRARAAFSTVAEALDAVGGIDKTLLERIQKITGDRSVAGVKAVDGGALNELAGPLIKSFFESELMKQLAKIAGLVAGGIAKAVVDMIGLMTGAAKSKGVNNIAEGFKDGIREAFGGMSFNDVKSVISEALTSILAKSMDVLFTQVLPNLLDMYLRSLFSGLLSGQLIPTIMAGLGIAKIAGLFAPLVSLLAGAFPIVTGLIGAFGGVLLGVIGAVMGVVVIFRHLDFIASSLWEALKWLASGIAKIGLVVIKSLLALPMAIAALIKKMGLAWVPGIKQFVGMMDGANDAIEAGHKALSEGMQRNLDKIGQNTADSLQRTQDDFAAIRRGIGLDPAQRAVTGFTQATQDATKATREKTTAELSEITAAERTAINTTAGMDLGQYTKTKAEVAAQLAELRGDGPLPTGGSAGASEAMKKVEENSNNASSSIDNVTSSADKLAPAIEKTTSAIEAMPPKVDAALVGAATSAGNAITQAAQNLAKALNGAAAAIKNVGNSAKSSSTDSESGLSSGNAYSGFSPGDSYKSLPLADAIAKERSMMPAGADLMIANTSETVIPAYKGHMGESFKGLKFEEMEAAAGFNRMESYTEQLTEIANKTATKFAGMAGALGGGSATLNAMEALGHAHGLQTTSGFRPGDPGFHGVNRARDLSNGSGETPEMNKVAGIMASQFGSSLTELIYTPLGFSIKNGQKTGLISPGNHYHHIHVAVAEGLKQAAVFSSQKAALQYERQNMPAGASPMKVDLSSMTANSSEFGAGGVEIGSINIHGVDDPEKIANEVADQILIAVRRSAYGELYTS